MTQTAVCNRHHTVDQQLCRWLLLMLDRLSSSEVLMTQELIANMLGVRREGVTERRACSSTTACCNAGLKAAACSCYRLVRQGAAAA